MTDNQNCPTCGLPKSECKIERCPLCRANEAIGHPAKCHGHADPPPAAQTGEGIVVTQYLAHLTCSSDSTSEHRVYLTADVDRRWAEKCAELRDAIAAEATLRLALTASDAEIARLKAERDRYLADANAAYAVQMEQSIEIQRLKALNARVMQYRVDDAEIFNEVIRTLLLTLYQYTPEESLRIKIHEELDKAEKIIYMARIGKNAEGLLYASNYFMQIRATYDGVTVTYLEKDGELVDVRGDDLAHALTKAMTKVTE
jgi:hypothetical protein